MTITDFGTGAAAAGATAARQETSIAATRPNQPMRVKPAVAKLTLRSPPRACAGANLGFAALICAYSRHPKLTPQAPKYMRREAIVARRGSFFGDALVNSGSCQFTYSRVGRRARSRRERVPSWARRTR